MQVVKGVNDTFQVSIEVREKTCYYLLIMQHTLSPHKILTYIASYINSKYTLHKERKPV